MAYNVISAIFRGAGDSRRPMYFAGVACMVNILLDFIFTGACHLGAAGAALGTVCGQAASVILAAVFLKKRALGFPVTRKSLRVDKKCLSGILKVGIPIAMQDGLIQVAFLIITAIANSRGLVYASGVGIVEKIISFLFLVPSAFLAAISAITAQNMGAGKILRARHSLYYGLVITVSWGIFCCLFSQFFPHMLVGMFTRDRAVAAAGCDYLRAYSFDCVFPVHAVPHGMGGSPWLLFIGSALHYFLYYNLLQHIEREKSLIHISKKSVTGKFVIVRNGGLYMKRTLAKIIAAALVTGVCGEAGVVMTSAVTARTASAAVPSMQRKLTLKKGKAKVLKVKGKYIKKCKFSSTKKKIATVGKKGKVTAKKAGTCKIKAVVTYANNKGAKKYLKKTLWCKVTVSSKKPDAAINPPNYTIDDEFVKQNAEFSVNMAKNAMAEALEDGENVLISPESIINALALVLDGANGETQAQLRKNLCGDMEVETFHKRLSEYNAYLMASQDVKFHLANSIWARKDNNLTVKEDYLQRMKDFYGAPLFVRDFNNQTVEEINHWVDKNTEHMIPTIIDFISEDAMLYLMNALSFEGKWKKQYEDSQVKSGQTFTNIKGKKETATMLESKESLYVEDEHAVGVVKYYSGNQYAFMGILPNQGTTVKEYLEGMTGEDFIRLYQTRTYHDVLTKIPEFSYDYKTSLVSSMKAMGMLDVFDGEKADLSSLAQWKDGNLYVGDVLHKTHIELDRNGTKAAAVTSVIMEAASAMPEDKPKQVYLDRPFLYVIIDTESGLPLFIGAVNSVNK